MFFFVDVVCFGILLHITVSAVFVYSIYLLNISKCNLNQMALDILRHSGLDRWL